MSHPPTVLLAGPPARTAADLIEPLLSDIGMHKIAETDLRRLLTGTCGIPAAYLEAFRRIAADWYAQGEANNTPEERANNATRVAQIGLLAAWLHMAKYSSGPEGDLVATDLAGWYLIIGRAWADKADLGASEIISEWAGVPHGWMYSAAGLAPEEASALISTGAVDHPTLRAMAALRRIPLPTPLPGETTGDNYSTP